MRSIGIIILSVFFSLGLMGQSATVTDFSNTSEGYNLYLYQSLIRMLNQDANHDFNMLIRDLDHLKFITDTRATSDESVGSTFRELDQGIRSEGFESIMSIDNKDYILHLYHLESRGSKAHWVATFFMEGMTGVLEMKGTLDTKYLHAFSSLDYEQLQKLLPLDDDNEIIDDSDEQ
ncbi:MAG: DUF4252 domain-containing protein [Saprospiraceae bacterium]|nr:DUF4252 domain-containing protein [Saprospiraceae bacterium]